MDLFLLSVSEASTYCLVGLTFSIVLARVRVTNFSHGYLMLSASWWGSQLVRQFSSFDSRVVLVLVVALLPTSWLMKLLIDHLGEWINRRLTGEIILLGTVGIAFSVEGLVSIRTNGNSIRYPSVGMVFDNIRSFGGARRYPRFLSGCRFDGSSERR